MIGFFPVPFPDEILYSVFARYHARARYKSLASTTQTLFGQESSRIIVDLPNKLGSLVNQLPPGNTITADCLIYKNTVFPFYVPFLPPDRIKQLKRDMTEKSAGGAIHARIGILTSKIEVEFLRFCPLCANNDYEMYGEPYWHRIHQLPGIFVCPYHSVFLENSSVRCSYYYRRNALVRAKDEISIIRTRPLDLSDKDHIAHLFLAKQADWLLSQNNLEYCGPNFFRKKFLHLLFWRGLASIKGTVSITKTEKEFEEFYNHEFLSYLSSTFDNKHTWLRRLLQTSYRFQHPIKNLLFIYFLGLSLKEIVQLPEVIDPLGTPPFPCLNPASKHYRELRVTKFIVNKYNEKTGISATFSCDCGFAYSRHNLEKNKHKIYEKDRVVSYGDIFNKKLLSLYNQGLSHKAIASKMYLSESIIKNQLANLRAKIKKHGSIKSTRRKSNQQIIKKRNSYRSQWKQLQRLNPQLNRTSLRKLNPKIGNWLYMKDMKWLNSNSPPRQVTKIKKFLVDWKKKDHEFSIKSEKLAIELLNSSSKPVRVSVTTLAKRLKIHHIITKRPTCLPLTIKILHNYAESTEEFITRRVRFTANYFIQKQEVVTYWKLLMKANVIVPHLVKLPKVQETVKSSLSEIKTLSDTGWKQL